MTNKTATRDDLNYNPHKLAIAEVGQNFLKTGKEGFPFAQKALELLLQDIGFSDPGIARTITDPGVIGKSLKNELDVYNEVTQGDSVGVTIDEYKTAFNEYLDGKSSDLAKRARSELRQFRNMSYQDIMLEVAKADHDIKGYKLGKNTKEEADAAEEVKEKYTNVVDTLMLLRQDRISDLTRRVEKSVTKDVFTEMYTPSEDSE